MGFNSGFKGLRGARRARHVARMGETRGAYRVLVGRTEGMRPLGRHRCGFEDNINFELAASGFTFVSW